MSAAAPKSAIVAASRCSAPCKKKATITIPSTMRDFRSKIGSRMLAAASIAPMVSSASLLWLRSLRNIRYSTPSTTGKVSRTTGVRAKAKSRKDRSAALPMRMLGGSPIRVAAPPTFEAITCVSRKGVGEDSRASAIRNVTGTISITVVTLSKNAERKAVTTERRMRMRPGRAFPHWALFMARYSKTPVLSRMATITIIPARSPMVFQSMNSLAACFWSRTPKAIRMAAPSRAATVRFSTSNAMSARTKTNSATAKSSCILSVDYTIGGANYRFWRTKEALMGDEEGRGGDLKIEDIMRPADTVQPETLAREALKIMREHNVPGVAVTDEDGTLQGFVTDGQLLEAALPKYMKMMDRLSFVPENADKWVHYLTGAADRPVGEVMSEEVSSIELGRSELAVAHRMVHDGVSSVVITRDGKVEGIVNRLDLYAAIVGLQ